MNTGLIISTSWFLLLHTAIIINLKFYKNDTWKQMPKPTFQNKKDFYKARGDLFLQQFCLKFIFFVLYCISLIMFNVYLEENLEYTIILFPLFLPITCILHDNNLFKSLKKAFMNTFILLGTLFTIPVEYQVLKTLVYFVFLMHNSVDTGILDSIFFKNVIEGRKSILANSDCYTKLSREQPAFISFLNGEWHISNLPSENSFSLKKENEDLTIENWSSSDNLPHKSLSFGYELLFWQIIGFTLDFDSKTLTAKTLLGDFTITSRNVYLLPFSTIKLNDVKAFHEACLKNGINIELHFCREFVDMISHSVPSAKTLKLFGITRRQALTMYKTISEKECLIFNIQMEKLLRQRGRTIKVFEIEDDYNEHLYEKRLKKRNRYDNLLWHWKSKKENVYLLGSISDEPIAKYLRIRLNFGDYGRQMSDVLDEIKLFRKKNLVNFKEELRKKQLIENEKLRMLKKRKPDDEEEKANKKLRIVGFHENQFIEEKLRIVKEDLREKKKIQDKIDHEKFLKKEFKRKEKEAQEKFLEKERKAMKIYEEEAARPRVSSVPKTMTKQEYMQKVKEENLKRMKADKEKMLKEEEDKKLAQEAKNKKERDLKEKAMRMMMEYAAREEQRQKEEDEKESKDYFDY